MQVLGETLELTLLALGHPDMDALFALVIRAVSWGGLRFGFGHGRDITVVRTNLSSPRPRSTCGNSGKLFTVA